mmetsp:Transcript_7360/g.33532  ORF Transcript_7360/g.33532 Transcript_7360/m.33532 type:complete len:305 (-) Transcript_7360:1497-2411(-)
MGVRGCSRSGRGDDRTDGPAGDGRAGYILTEACVRIERSAHAPPGPHRRGRHGRRRGVQGADLRRGRLRARARDQGGRPARGAYPVPVGDPPRPRRRAAGAGRKGRRPGGGVGGRSSRRRDGRSRYRGRSFFRGYASRRRGNRRSEVRDVRPGEGGGDRGGGGRGTRGGEQGRGGGHRGEEGRFNFNREPRARAGNGAGGGARAVRAAAASRAAPDPRAASRRSGRGREAPASRRSDALQPRGDGDWTDRGARGRAGDGARAELREVTRSQRSRTQSRFGRRPRSPARVSGPRRGRRRGAGRRP